jgi:hypothetical protein
MKRTALVTGASSGIGRAYAVYFAKEDYDLIITGRRLDKLNSLASELREKYNTNTEIIKSEFSRDKDVLKVVDAINSSENIYFLVNNAGYGSGMELQRSPLLDQMRMLNVHVVASVKLVNAVLPQMIRRKEGAIINVSSIGAYMPALGNAMYSATKLFLTSFTESLHMELHQHGIRVQCVCPGMTYSDFHNRRTVGHGLNASKLMWMEPEILVEKSIKSLNGKRIVLVPGIINKSLLGVVSLLPRRLYYLIMERTVNVNLRPGLFEQLKQFFRKAISY